MPLLKGYPGKPIKEFSEEKLKNILIPGNYCLVKSVHVNGYRGSPDISIFQIGERRLLHINDENKNYLGIHIQPQDYPIMKTKSSFVFDSMSINQFIHNTDFVSLFSKGVQRPQFYNEGTFSPAPGSYLSHTSGQYISEINVGQTFIKKKHAEIIDELELHKISIPFCLPSQYLCFNINPGTIPGVFEQEAKATIELLIENELLGSVPSIKEIRDAEEISQEKRKQYTHHKNWLKSKHCKTVNDKRSQRETHYKINQEFEELFQKKLYDAAVYSTLIQAIGGNLNHWDFFGRTNGAKFSQTNADYEILNNGDPITGEGFKLGKRLPRKSFTLIQSKFKKNLMYAVPKDQQTADFLMNYLIKFNNKFPDTQHIKSAKENFTPASILPLPDNFYGRKN